MPSSKAACRFHLGQSWWRNIETFGLASFYKKSLHKGRPLATALFQLEIITSKFGRKGIWYVKQIQEVCKWKKVWRLFKKELHWKWQSIPPSSWAGLTFKTTNNGAESFHRHFVTCSDIYEQNLTFGNLWEP